MSSKAIARHKRPIIALGLAGAALLLAAGDTMPDGRPTPSGQPVPRWLSLKSNEVYARHGPGLDHRILWVYRSRGLPVQVIAETREWRKVCDPEGAIAWVHRSVVSSNRRVYNRTGTDIDVRAARSPTARVTARLATGSVVGLEECREGWCRIGGRRTGGWLRADQVFGVQSRPLCDASRPAGRRADRR